MKTNKQKLLEYQDKQQLGPNIRETMWAWWKLECWEFKPIQRGRQSLLSSAHCVLEAVAPSC